MNVQVIVKSADAANRLLAHVQAPVIGTTVTARGFLFSVKGVALPTLNNVLSTHALLKRDMVLVRYA